MGAFEKITLRNLNGNAKRMIMYISMWLAAAYFLVPIAFKSNVMEFLNNKWFPQSMLSFLNGKFVIGICLLWGGYWLYSRIFS